MKPTTLHQAEPKARSSDLIPAHIAEELRRYDHICATSEAGCRNAEASNPHRRFAASSDIQ